MRAFSQSEYNQQKYKNILLSSKIVSTLMSSNDYQIETYIYGDESNEEETHIIVTRYKINTETVFCSMHIDAYIRQIEENKYIVSGTVFIKDSEKSSAYIAPFAEEIQLIEEISTLYQEKLSYTIHYGGGNNNNGEN